jgi:hypothetical protein
MATATLKLTRKWGGAGDHLAESTQDYSIVLDGNVVGSIAPNATCEFTVERGSHTLGVRSPRHASPERTFQIGDGQVVTFTTRHAVFWPQMLAAMIKPDLWISLKQSP